MYGCMVFVLLPMNESILSSLSLLLKTGLRIRVCASQPFHCMPVVIIIERRVPPV